MSRLVSRTPCRHFARSTGGRWRSPPPGSSIRRGERRDARRRRRASSASRRSRSRSPRSRSLVAAEEGVVDLDEPAGPPGSTVRHLLAHTSGLPFEGTTPIARPGHRRIYSNEAFRVLAASPREARGDAVRRCTCARRSASRSGSGSTRTATPAPGCTRRSATCSPSGASSCGRRLVADGDAGRDGRASSSPGLSGVLPNHGRFDPLDWGLGVQLNTRPSVVDGDAHLGADVRPLRRHGDVPLGRSRRRASSAPRSPSASSASGRRSPGRCSRMRSWTSSPARRHRPSGLRPADRGARVVEATSATSPFASRRASARQEGTLSRARPSPASRYVLPRCWSAKSSRSARLGRLAMRRQRLVRGAPSASVSEPTQRCALAEPDQGDDLRALVAVAVVTRSPAPREGGRSRSRARAEHPPGIAEVPEEPRLRRAASPPELRPRAAGRPARRGASQVGGQSSAKSGRTSSSNVAASQLATTHGVIAVTVAVRGTFIVSATSPK